MSRPKAIGFAGGGSFYGALKARGRLHLSDPRRARRAQRQIYLKSAVMLGWAGGQWALLMFAANGWWQAGILTLSLGLALAGIGFNLPHDANHGAYSARRWLNWVMRW